MKVLLVDNYDSFTYNLFQLLGSLGAPVVVARNDSISRRDVDALDPSHVVLSPGPGHPARARDFGIGAELVKTLSHRPLLGICLGHQGIAHYLGGRVMPAPTIMHGKVSTVDHDGSCLFRGLPPAFEAMRYHSLTVDPASLPPGLRVNASTPDGVAMGLVHDARPLFGLQFHPESIGTPLGSQLLANFLEMT